MAKSTHKSASINPLETLNQWGGDELKKVGQDFSRDFFAELLGKNSTEQPREKIASQGDLQPGQELMLGKSKAKLQTPEQPRKLEAAPAMKYHEQFRSIDSQISVKETSEIKRAIEDIKFELQRLVSSSQVLQAEFGQVSFAQTPTTPGTYHVNFFQWVLTVIKQARMKVEDAGAWQAAIKGKGKGKKGKSDFWSRAGEKNEGTSFLLHHDRNVSTQTG